MNNYARIVAVTGANKGIGLATVRQLALRYESSPLNTGPLLIYLTARQPDRGKAAVHELNSDDKLLETKALRSSGGLTDIRYLPLDVSNKESIEGFAETIKSSHPNGLDILINNAGVALDGFSASLVKQTLHTNYFGTLHMIHALLPQIRDGGRIVNVASRLGRLTTGNYSEAIQRRFRDAKTTEDITRLMNDYQSAVERDDFKKEWPSSGYAVSKAGVIGMTRTEARRLKDQGTNVLINSCCPGFIRTEMTKGKGRHTPDQGAEMPVQLALDDLGGVSGGFWLGGELSEW